MIEAFLTLSTAVLICLYASWLALAMLPSRRGKGKQRPSVSVIIPAHNEAANIARTVASLGKEHVKEIIVVDDGSTDGTAAIAKKIPGVTLIRKPHQGKAHAINHGLKAAKGDVLVILDADTEIEKGAVEKILEPFSDAGVGAVASTLRVKRSWRLLNWFQQLEYAVISGWRAVVDKANALCITPGFCAFRRSALLEVGGFRGETAVEDYDICMWLAKAGWKTRMVPAAIARTRVPESLRGLVLQRIRWNRGTAQVLKRHFSIAFARAVKGIGFYTMPTQAWWFVHAFLYVPIVLWQIASGYDMWFVSKGMPFSHEAGLYFAKWLTPVGMADFIYRVAIGEYAMSTLNLLTILVFVLSYTWLAWALVRFGDRDLRPLLALCLMFPYSVLTLSTYILAVLRELLPGRGERWEKVW